MAKFLITETVGTTSKTRRLGAGTGAAQRLDDKDVGKIVKVAGESRMDLTTTGDAIEGFVTSVETATLDGFSYGGVMDCPSGTVKAVVFDGAQADGTGALAIGDFVVSGPQEAKQTAMATSYAKVRKATDQAAAKATGFAWRVVSLGTAASGAVGTVGMIERV